MSKNKKSMEYGMMIHKAITNLFRDEPQQVHLDVEELGEGHNLTEFIIGFIKAGAVLHNELTGENETLFEFTQTLNYLCVQNMLNSEDLRIIDEDEEDIGYNWRKE